MTAILNSERNLSLVRNEIPVVNSVSRETETTMARSVPSVESLHQNAEARIGYLAVIAQVTSDLTPNYQERLSLGELYARTLQAEEAGVDLRTDDHKRIAMIVNGAHNQKERHAKRDLRMGMYASSLLISHGW